MNRTIATALTLLAVLGTGARARAQATTTVGVHDGAAMFSEEAVKEANETLREVHRRTHWSALIETVDSLDGKTIKDAALGRARALKEHGLYILMAKKEHKFYAAPSHLAEKTFPKDAIQALDDTILNAFKVGKFDQGLRDAVTLIRHDAEAAPDLKAGAEVVPAPPVPAIRKTPDAPVAVRRPEPTAAPGPQSQPRPVSNPPVASNAPWVLLIGGGGVILLLWLLSRVFRGSTSSSAPPYRQPNVDYGPGPGSAPGPGYAPQPQARPGYVPQPQPQPRPGYAPQAPQPGYGPPPQPGYGGYAPPPPQQGGGHGGGFLSGVLGGAAGAVAGNILYDKFGRPHEAPGGAPPHMPGSVVPPQGTPWPQDNTGGAAIPPDAPAETFDPNAGGGGDWGTPESAPPSNADTGAGGDWGTPEPAAAEPDAPGADWGTPEPAADPGAGGDWGSAEPEAPADAGGDWSTPDQPADTGGGGDWGATDPGTDDTQGGSW